MADREMWEFVNSFAPWLAALGTIFAASIALFLARRNVRHNLRVEIMNEMQDTLGIPLDIDKLCNVKYYLTVRIVNDGPREALLTHIAWVDGWVRKVSIGLARHEDSVLLPVRLCDGDEVRLRYDPQLFFDMMLREPRSLDDRGQRRTVLAIETFVQRCMGWSGLRARVTISTEKSFFDRFPRAMARSFTEDYSIEPGK